MKSNKASAPNAEELQKAAQVERSRYIKVWNDFVRDFIVDYGKVPMPGLMRTFSDDVKFELGRIEFFDANEDQKRDAKKSQSEDIKKNAKVKIELAV